MFDAGVGYSYVNLPLGDSRVSLNGADANLGMYFSPYFGLRLDVGYARDNNVFQTGHNADMFSYLIGPVIYPVRHRKSSVYAQALVGAARVTGPVPTETNGLLLRGYANKFAWALGGGLERRLSRSFTFRAGADYLHTAYFAPSRALVGQSDLRVTTGLVYTFGRRNR